MSDSEAYVTDQTYWMTARESLSDDSTASSDLVTPCETTTQLRTFTATSNLSAFGPSPYYPESPASVYSRQPCRINGTPLLYLEDQRHPGKQGAQISSTRKPLNYSEPEPKPEVTNQPDPELDLGLEEHGSQVLILDSRGRYVKNSRQVKDSVYNAEGASNHVHGWPLFYLILGICLAVFLVSIDRTIVTTAIPYITREFKSTDEIGWYGSAYLITSCAFQPMFGKIYLSFSIKIVYLAAILLFEIGSLICALSPQSTVLIIGRAVAGLGSAGILTGSFVIVAIAIPLEKRPVYTAIVGIIFGVGATTGPLLGGIFTDLVTWRWCFWINLPVGAITLIACIFCFHPAKREQHALSLQHKLASLDFIGNTIFLGAAIMLFLALELTTEDQSWHSATPIGLLCGSGVLFLVFVFWLWWRQTSALLPPHIITQRTVAASCIMAFLIYGALLAQTYFLPIWFQAILGRSALQSGVNMIPYFVINAAFSFIAGVLVSKTGYYIPLCLFGNAHATVGAGLFTLLSPKTTTAQWVGFQIVVAAGLGLSIQQGFTAVQTVLPEESIAVGIAAVVACQSFGGAIFVSVANSIFQSQLVQAKGVLPDTDVQEVLDAGATAFRDLLPHDAVEAILPIYNAAIQKVFIATVPLLGAAFLAGFMLEWRSIKTVPKS